MNEPTKAARALDGIPVTAIYNDGREEETTVAKAVGVGHLAKEARSEWAEVAKKLDYAFAEAGWFEKTDPETARKASEKLAAADPIGRFNRVYKAYKAEQAYKRAEKRLTSLIKAELINRRTAAMKKKRVKLERKTALAKAQAEDAAKVIAESEQVQESLLAEHEAFLADAERRIDAMTARLEAGQAQIRDSRERQAIADLARLDQIWADWAYKASLTNDPTLRAVYMARAEGSETNNDEV